MILTRHTIPIGNWALTTDYAGVSSSRLTLHLQHPPPHPLQHTPTPSTAEITGRKVLLWQALVSALVQ